MRRETRYGRIYQDLLEAIVSGKYLPGSKLPTVSQIAEQYGVSQITSKKALGMLAGEGYIVQTPGKGTFVSQELPTNAANRKADATGNIVGIVTNGFSSNFGIDFIRGVQDESARHGGLVAISCVYGNQAEETREITRMIDNGIKGLIIMPVHGISYNPGILVNLLNNYPLVLADRYMTGLSIPFVGTKNTQSSVDLVNYLFSMGHRHVAFVSSAITTTALRERLDGYVDAHARSNNALNDDLIVDKIQYTMPNMNKEPIFRQDVEMLKEFYTAHPEVTATMAVDSNVFLLVEQAMKALGRKIPDDMSVVCYDEILNYPRKATHIRQRQYDMGVKAAELLYERLKDKAAPPRQILLDYDLVEGDSVRRIPQIDE